MSSVSKLRRYFFIGGAAVVLILVVGGGLGVAWLNSFIHSEAFRLEVEAKASAAVGGTVEIHQIDFGLFGGVKMNGLAAKLLTDQGTLVTQVQGVSCAYSLLGLLNRHLQLDGLTLVHPEFFLTQQPPASVAMPKPPGGDGKKAPEDSGKLASFQFSLESVTVKDGHLLLKDAKGAIKAELLGIDSQAKTGGYFTNKDVTGSVAIAAVNLPQNLTIRDVSSSFVYNQGVVEAKPFKATAFDGAITGDFKLDPSAPSLLTIHAEQVDMAQVGQAATPNSPTRLSGRLDLQSIWHGAETAKLTGEGDAQIADAKLVGVVLLNELATAFNLPALHDPEMKKITTHFQVANGTTNFDHLVIESDMFGMTGRGTIDPQGGLSADMVMTLNPQAMKIIPGIAAAAFQKGTDGSGTIAFHLAGTVQEPESDFMAKAFISGSKVNKTISKTFQNLFK